MKKIYKVNNVSDGALTHVILTKCDKCEQSFEYYLDEKKGAKDPILSIGLDEANGGQQCPTCNNVVYAPIIRSYNIFEN